MLRLLEAAAALTRVEAEVPVTLLLPRFIGIGGYATEHRPRTFLITSPDVQPLTFTARTSGSDDLKTIISAISTLVEEATFDATAEGITFRGMDPSHVALIDISWPNSAFERYECDSDVKFGVRIDEFSKIIKRADKKDSIDLGISEDNKLLISVGRNKKYKIRLIESSATDTPLPKVPYDTKIVVPTTKFDKVLGDVQVVSEYLTVKASSDVVEFSGRGDSGEVAIELAVSGTRDSGSDDTNASENIIEEVDTETESTGTYSLEYLNPVIKAVGSATSRVTCEFSSAKPLRLECKIANIGRIHFYLAPRVEG